MDRALPGLTGTFSWSERSADAVRNALAHDPADLSRPELADVSMQVFMPVSPADPTLWTKLIALRGEVVWPGNAGNFRQVNLGQEILKAINQRLAEY